VEEFKIFGNSENKSKFYFHEEIESKLSAGNA
jgi:hypothetical protein